MKRRRGRREFIGDVARWCAGSVAVALATACGLSVPPTGRTAKVPRIGWLSAADEVPSNTKETFLSALRDLGYVDGQTIAVEWRGAGGDPGRIVQAAADLAALPVDVIVTEALDTTVAAKNATHTIPIVFVNVAEPASNGLVASDARPGANLTGLRTAPELELGPKRLQLLKDIMPRIARVAVLWNATNPNRARDVAALQLVGPTLGVEIRPVEVRVRDDLAGALADLHARKPDALIITGDALVLGRPESRKAMLDFAMREEIALVTNNNPEAVADGYLMAYGSGRFGPEDIGRVATLVDRILKGALPADIPVESPTRVDLAINLCTAGKLGITVPPSVMAQVTQLIQCRAQ